MVMEELLGKFLFHWSPNSLFRFIAPEVIKSQNSRSFYSGLKADVWSFGMMMYEVRFSKDSLIN